MRRNLTIALFAALALLAALAVAGSFKKGAAHSYKVAVVDGDGALNNLPSHAAHPPVVKVADESGKPVSGVRVEFDTPKAGPGASFAGGSTHFATTTNAEGVARASGLKNNGVPGGFAMVVRVTSEGQTLANVTLHQTNVTSKMAHMSSSPRSQQEAYPDASISTAALGVALGDQFLVNGVPTPTTANLEPGNRLQTESTPVTIYIHDHCEFLIGPHSSVIIQPHLLSVMGGAVRAKHFGDCKFGYGGLWVTSPSPTGDAVVALSNEHMEVGSVTGPIQIANAVKVVGTVQPGTVSAINFGTTDGASGATVSAPTSRKVAFMLGVSTGAALLGLGIAVDAIVQSSHSQPVPS